MAAPRPVDGASRGGRYAATVAGPILGALRDLAQEEQATLFMTLLAAFQALLHRYTGTDDIVVGTPIAGRRRLETEALIGVFLNALALRTDLSGTLHGGLQSA